MSAQLMITLGVIYASFSALGIAAGASILRKAGYSPWWVVTGFIPLVNVVMVLVFAFSDWPALRPTSYSPHAAAVHAGADPRFTYPAA